MSRFGETPKSETAAFDYYWGEMKTWPLDPKFILGRLEEDQERNQRELHHKGITSERADELGQRLSLMPRIILELNNLSQQKQGNLILGDLAELHVQEKFGEPIRETPLWSCLTTLLQAAKDSAYRYAYEAGIDLEDIELAVQTDQAWVNMANQIREEMKKHPHTPPKPQDDYDEPGNIFETDEAIIEISSSWERGELPVGLIAEEYIEDQIGKRLFGPAWKIYGYDV